MPRRRWASRGWLRRRSGGFNWLPDAFGLVKDTALDIASLTGWARRNSVFAAQLDLAVISTHASAPRRVLRRYGGVFDDVVDSQIGYYITGEFPVVSTSLSGLRRSEQLIIRTIQRTLDDLPSPPIHTRFAPQLRLRGLPKFTLLKAGLGPALDVALGGYLQYLEDRDSPYLTPGQKGLRVITTGVGSAGTALLIGEGLVALGCSATVVCGIAAGVTAIIVWNVAQPVVFDFPVFAPADRNLRPLEVP